MRYEEITNFDDIIGGATGKTDKVKESVDFLTEWSKTIANIINMLASFFKQLLGYTEDAD